MFASISSLDLPRFKRLLKVSFPQVKDSIDESKSEYRDELLLSSVKQQVLSDSLYDKEQFIQKVSSIRLFYFC